MHLSYHITAHAFNPSTHLRSTVGRKYQDMLHPTPATYHTSRVPQRCHLFLIEKKKEAACARAGAVEVDLQRHVGEGESPVRHRRLECSLNHSIGSSDGRFLKSCNSTPRFGCS